jgi:hypothetical protein
MHNLLQFWNAVESIAIFTAILALGALRLSAGADSFFVDTIVSIEVVILSRPQAHHTKPYVPLCWTSEGDPSSRPVREFPVTANIERTTQLLFKGSLTVSSPIPLIANRSLS